MGTSAPAYVVWDERQSNGLVTGRKEYAKAYSHSWAERAVAKLVAQQPRWSERNIAVRASRPRDGVRSTWMESRIHDLGSTGPFGRAPGLDDTQPIATLSQQPPWVVVRDGRDGVRVVARARTEAAARDAAMSALLRDRDGRVEYHVHHVHHAPWVDALGGRLSSAQRKRLPSSAFALPGRRFPVHDLAHARNARARGVQAYRRGRLSRGELWRIWDATARRWGLPRRPPAIIGGPDEVGSATPRGWQKVAREEWRKAVGGEDWRVRRSDDGRRFLARRLRGGVELVFRRATEAMRYVDHTYGDGA